MPEAHESYLNIKSLLFNYYTKQSKALLSKFKINLICCNFRLYHNVTNKAFTKKNTGKIQKIILSPSL